MSRTVLVFEEEAILAAAGQEGRKPHIRQVERVLLTGYGDSFSRWKEGLAGLRGKLDLSRVRLILPSTMCSTKMIQIPYAKGKQLDTMARREMEEAFRSEIMDYAVVEAEKTGMSLCCGSVEETVLKQFREMLSALGIEAAEVSVPMEGYLRVLSNLEAYKEKTAIFLFFEEGGMTSVLTQDGQYRYSSKSRLFSERGTLDFGTEIIRSISGILQFQSASKSGAAITDIYYAGCSDADFEVSLEGISGMNLAAHRLEPERGITLPDGARASDWMACVGAMMAGVRGQRDMNLKPVPQETESAAFAREFGRQMILPAAVFAAGLAAAGVLFGIRVCRESRTADIREWMQSEEVQSGYQKVRVLEAAEERMVNAVSSLRYTERNLATYPTVDSGVTDKIELAGGRDIEVTLQSYDKESGVLNFEATSEEVINIPEYILKLQNTGLFYAVDYTGYVYDDSYYRLTLSCMVQGVSVGGETE